MIAIVDAVDADADGDGGLVIVLMLMLMPIVMVMVVIVLMLMPMVMATVEQFFSGQGELGESWPFIQEHFLDLEFLASS